MIIRRMKGLVALLAVLGSAGAAVGKSPPNRTPQLDSPKYWDEHVIVHGVVQVQGAEGKVSVQVLNQFSGDDKWPAAMVFSTKEIWLEPHAREFEPPWKLEGYDHVFITSGRGKADDALVVYRPEKEEAGTLAESCRLIQEVRSGKDLAAAFQRVVKAGDAVAERYVLNALMATDLKAMDDKVVAAVMALRADSSVDLHTRMVASDLVQAAAAAKGEKNDDWEWCAEVLREEKSQTFEHFRELSQRLVGKDAAERLRTIDLICELAKDSEGPVRRRAAMVSAGNISDLIGKGGPRDAGNMKMMELCSGLMGDGSAMVRASAAYALWQMSNRLRYEQGREWKPMLDIAVAAIRKAEDKEVADDMKIWMKNYRVMIEEFRALPEAP